MGVANKRTSSGTAKREGGREKQGLSSHELAIERLREIAEHGLDDTALDGCKNLDGSGCAGPGAEVEPDGGRPVTDEILRSQARIVEALVFAAPQPLSEKKIAEHLPPDADVQAVLAVLAADYAGRGVGLVRVAGKWTFRTADDLSYLLEKYAVEERRLSKAALETMAIIAYHQPVTRAEIEEIRGVQTSRGTLDVLLATNWIRPRGRRRAPGKPLTYGTTDEFLSHFGLQSLSDLPGLGDLKAAGLLDSDLPPDFAAPDPKHVAGLLPDELPLDEDTADGFDDDMFDDDALDNGALDESVGDETKFDDDDIGAASDHIEGDRADNGAADTIDKT